jgi:hypothetical protein
MNNESKNCFIRCEILEFWPRCCLSNKFLIDLLKLIMITFYYNEQ